MAEIENAVETEEQNALIEKEVGTIVTQEFLNDLEKFEELKAAVEAKEEEIRSQLLELFEKNGIKSFKNDRVTISYKDSYIRTSVDSNKLKREGLYDDFAKQTIVKASIVLKVNYD